MHRLIIFASGRGSNAQAILDYFKKEGGAEVALIVTNKADAGIVDIAQREGIPYLLANNKRLSEGLIIEELRSINPSLIVLAGFLLKIPSSLIEAFPGRIINIHPALLPKWGGKGMWGHHVHNAVLSAGEVQTGITIHLVDEEYDHGTTLLQATCPVLPGDDAAAIAARIQKLEHFYYPRTIQFLLREMPVEPETQA
jgi:phosphoribosylglycinamide formyltransferase-1